MLAQAYTRGFVLVVFSLLLQWVIYEEDQEKQRDFFSSQ